jgi:hypothetical protein
VVHWVDVSQKVSVSNFNMHSYHIQIVLHYLCNLWLTTPVLYRPQTFQVPIATFFKCH